jgi:ABC-type multidrug transport system fused ATPase/permease subunit
MRAIMKQDTQYFDFNASSVLQQRLNHDANELVQNLLHVPRMTLMHLFRVTQRLMTLYFTSPQMMWACLQFNVPLFTLCIFATGATLRRLYGQRDRGSEVSLLPQTHTLPHTHSFTRTLSHTYTLSVGLHIAHD